MRKKCNVLVHNHMVHTHASCVVHMYKKIQQPSMYSGVSIKGEALEIAIANNRYLSKPLTLVRSEIAVVSLACTHTFPPATGLNIICKLCI